ncbi:hypothetical protein [Parendozoicomonas sp. Alg238-R29]|nr:hypothetical protein [Parendozoicomonas sp. Alg238-R29]
MLSADSLIDDATQEPYYLVQIEVSVDEIHRLQGKAFSLECQQIL